MGLGQAGQLQPISPAGQQLQCPLIELIESGLRGTLLKLNVAEPAFDGELVPHDFLLIGEVLLLLPGPGYREKTDLFSEPARSTTPLQTPDPSPGPRSHTPHHREPGHQTPRYQESGPDPSEYHCLQSDPDHQTPWSQRSRPDMRPSPRHHSFGLPNQAIHSGPDHQTLLSPRPWSDARPLP